PLILSTCTMAAPAVVSCPADDAGTLKRLAQTSLAGLSSRASQAGDISPEGPRTMPVDYTDLLIALAVWIGGTGYAYDRIRAAMMARHDAAAEGLLPAVRPIFWTMWVSIALAILSFFVACFYEWIFGR